MPGPESRPLRDDHRRRAAERLLDALDDLVRKHRAFARHDEHGELHAELITAEVAHQLAMARNALRMR